MKKTFWIAIISILTLGIGVALAPNVAYALPYTTETVGPNQQISTAPDVYIPSRKIVIPDDSDLSLTSFNGAEDMIYDEGSDLIFVADTSNRRIVILKRDDPSFSKEYLGFIDNSGNEIKFKTPIGLAENDKYLLVADKGLEEIIVFEKENMNFVREIKRPTSQLVGSLTRFVPLKICLDNRGNLYVVLEGSTKGIMQMDLNGEFVGYIGANQTNSTLLSKLQNIFNVKNDDYILSAGQAVTNVAIDSKGLVYTVTNKATDGAIKKLNTTGNPILSPAINEEKTVQIFVDSSDNIYSVQSDGYITAFDSYGALLFRFGGRNEEEILGSLKSPVAISGTSNHEILVLDKEANLILEYEPTNFANLIFDAVDYYRDGLYLQGEDSWKEVLKKDSRFILAYKALGKASMKRGQYDTALKQFKLAEDKEDYSEAYWKIRDEWIRKNLGFVLIPIIAIVVVVLVYKTLKRKKPALVAPFVKAGSVINSTPVIKDITFGFRFMRHPSESVYEIKNKKKGSLIGAIILYVVFAVVQILKVVLTGYLFNNVNGNVDGIRTILISIALLLALVLANQFVSSVTDGEGKLKDTFISFIYALMPYLVLAIPIFLISRVLTYNESFIYYVLLIVAYGWSAINIVLTIMELHDYSFWKALLNIILTVICLVLALVFIFIIYLLGYQLISFLIGLFKGL